MKKSEREKTKRGKEKVYDPMIRWTLILTYTDDPNNVSNKSSEQVLAVNGLIWSEILFTFVSIYERDKLHRKSIW